MSHSPPYAPILGRDDDIIRIETLIDTGPLPVITLLGPGGVGKTRLAHEVSGIMAETFAHGATFVGLENVRDPIMTPNAVARGLGIQPGPDTDVHELLAEVLADRHMLLVLDNLEHIVNVVAAWLPRLLERAPRLRILATSRIPLRIEAEQQYAVGPLPTSFETVEDSAAVTLFVQRAQAVSPDFDPDHAERAIVADICRQLDGLPLAIELAAARVKVLPPKEMLAHLDHRLSFLSGGKVDAPSRRQSMRATIQWSYDLLSDAERLFYRRLSVFFGGFTLDAADFVAGWDVPPHAQLPALTTLQSLVDQNLVQPVADSAGRRFRMLETIREFGVNETGERGEDRITLAAHAEYFRALAERADVHLRGRDQARWMRRLDIEYANIIAAIDWLVAAGQLEDAIFLGGAIRTFLADRGHGAEIAGRAEAWLADPHLTPGSRAQAMALLVTGTMVGFAGETARAIGLLREAATLFRDLGDGHQAALAFEALAEFCESINEYEDMRVAVEASLDLAEPLRLHALMSTAWNRLSYYAFLRGDEERDQFFIQKSYAAALEAGDVRQLAFHCCFRSDDARDRGDLDRAEHEIRQAIDAFTMLESRRDLSHAWMRLAWIVRLRGDLETARTHADRGLELAESVDHRWLATHGHLRRSVIDVERGRIDLALESLRHAISRYGRQRHPIEIARCLDVFAFAALRAGDAASAARFLGAVNRQLSAFGVDHRWMDPIANGFLDEDRLRATLGSEQYDGLFAEGEALTLEQAIVGATAYRPPTLLTRAGGTCDQIPDLSPRERDVLTLMTNGMSNQQIADMLFISYRTVSTHVTSILAKLEVPSRTAAVSFAIRNGMA